VLDERTAAELAAGRLVREQEAVGLFGAAPVEADSARKAAASRRDAGAAVSGKRPADRTEAPKVVERRRRLERELATARADELKAKREHARAAKATERAGKHAKDAQMRADQARKRADEASALLREAERQERDAARAYDRAARAAASAEKKLPH
jgi:hypothetical protein